jgi:hypothetical protein
MVEAKKPSHATVYLLYLRKLPALLFPTTIISSNIAFKLLKGYKSMIFQPQLLTVGVLYGDSDFFFKQASFYIFLQNASGEKVCYCGNVSILLTNYRYRECLETLAKFS